MLNNAKIGKRLGIGFAFAILVTIVLSIIAINSFIDSKGKLETLTKLDMKKTSQANSLIDAVNVQARSMRNLLLFNQVSDNERDMKRIEDSKESIKASIAYLENIKSVEGRKLFDTMKPSREKYLEEVNIFLDKYKSGQKDECIILLSGSLRAAQTEYFDNITKLIEFQDHLAVTVGEETAKKINNEIIIFLILLITSTFISIWFALWITKSVVNPVNQCMDAANKIADGDINVAFKIDFNDETAHLMHAMENMSKISDQWLMMPVCWLMRLKMAD